MNSIDALVLCSTIPDNVTSEICRRLKNHNRYLAINCISLDLRDLESVPVTYRGFAVRELLDKARFRPKDGTQIQVLLTALPFDRDARIVRAESPGIFAVSLYRVREEKVVAAACALIFACLVDTKSEITHTDVEEEPCIFGASKFDPCVPMQLCGDCGTRLALRAPLVRVKLEAFSSDKATTGKIVFIQHGIRDDAEWFQEMKSALKDCEISSYGFRYYYFDLFRFFFHRLFSSSIKLDLRRRIEGEMRRNPNSEISVIAHSFGTLLISELLKESPDPAAFRLDKLILLNGIVPCKFDWDALCERGSVGRVLNECCGNDVFPVLAGKFVPYTGKSGTMGFSDSFYVRNCFHKGKGHGDLLKKDTRSQCEDAWVPFLLTDGSMEWSALPEGPYLSSLVKMVDRTPAIALVAMVVGVTYCVIMAVRFILTQY